MSEQNEEFFRDLDRAFGDPEHWAEILAPWIGVERPIAYANGVTGVEVLVGAPEPGRLDFERHLVVPRPAEHITFHFAKEEP